MLERNALTGRHSRFDEIEFGASWEELVRNADRFPSSNKTVGLGRSFAWNQWAQVNGVVDDDFRVRRGEADRAVFLDRAWRFVRPRMLGSRASVLRNFWIRSVKVRCPTTHPALIVSPT
ncbi:hypothetical protein [Rhizobium metallidurans]|uniref:Uncharacterized protein n=1 Tax=Rhizobium metallidurans TaxID=1265931 RepID=A0A7W6CRF9_9HYPH|nr:hypothetical protein [Rhizobium metallidurans]MBB3965818.1 hypothetical protein [Rhizobium metallidurans]